MPKNPFAPASSSSYESAKVPSKARKLSRWVTQLNASETAYSAVRTMQVFLKVVSILWALLTGLALVPIVMGFILVGTESSAAGAVVGAGLFWTWLVWAVVGLLVLSFYWCLWSVPALLLEISERVERHGRHSELIANHLEEIEATTLAQYEFTKRETVKI